MKLNKTVLITGSSKGIGRAIACKLAAEGYDLVLHCRSSMSELESLANSLQKEFNTDSHLLQFDVSDRVASKDSLESYLAKAGAPYGVVCNAGLTADNAFPAMLGEEWDSIIDTNLGSFYNVLHPLVMPMVSARKPGLIITM
jgi:3-oxoacyl-[acyl-carrier protein] reductase